MTDTSIKAVGFVGLGVMGEPMCANLAQRTPLPVHATDLRREPLERLAAAGVHACASPAEVAEQANLLFLSLPSGVEVEQVCVGPDGLADRPGRVRIVVDTSTSPVATTRRIADRLGAAGIAFADAPIARTREAARKGELSIMVGANDDVFAAIAPFLRLMGSDVTHCGPVGCGQVVKILNNIVLFQTVVALAEALTIGRRAGMDGTVLFETLAKGSADSFALRNHGMKALLPAAFPESAFPTDYALKDIGYALELAAQTGIAARGATLARELLRETTAAGFGSNYFPALLNVIEGVTERNEHQGGKRE